MTSDLRYVCCALLLALAACGGDKSNSQGTAGGEVLPGSASDAMLPVDRIKSQPPTLSGAELDAEASDKAGSKVEGKTAAKEDPEKTDEHSPVSASSSAAPTAPASESGAARPTAE